MGVSIYPVLDRDLPGVAGTEVPGKALAAAVFAEGSAFAALVQFLSQNAEWFGDFTAEDARHEADAIKVPAEVWFLPEAGLLVVRSLLKVDPIVPESTEPKEFRASLLADLQHLEQVLLMAQTHGAQFHLAVDF